MLTIAQTPADVKAHAEDLKTAGGVPTNFPGTTHVSWRATRIAPPYVALVSIRVDGFGHGETLSFTPNWLDQRGQSIRPSVANAHAIETDIADLDSAGRVLWRRRVPSAGRFVFSAGGWRADTVIAVSRDSLGGPYPLDEQRTIIREAMRRWKPREARSEK